jgi:hypothetical protein
MDRLEGAADREATVTRRITSKVAAEMIGIATATLANKRSRHEGPPGWLRISKTCVVYDLDLVEKWIAERAAENATRP